MPDNYKKFLFEERKDLIRITIEKIKEFFKIPEEIIGYSYIDWKVELLVNLKIDNEAKVYKINDDEQIYKFFEYCLIKDQPVQYLLGEDIDDFQINYIRNNFVSDYHPMHNYDEKLHRRLFFGVEDLKSIEYIFTDLGKNELNEIIEKYIDKNILI